ncbi:MAG: hypothetical protein MR805_02960, partial [Schaalia hyovaginalis]|nr:hypothetical protein [Schaalia hyovaginalis]
MTPKDGGGLRAYAALLRRPRVARFLFGGVVVQFPYAMVNMALLIGARDAYGSYSSAGIAAAVMSIAGAIIGPNVGRLFDRYGQTRVTALLAAFWISSMLLLGAVLVLALPYWALLVVVVMLGASIPGGSLIRARWRVVLAREPATMSRALSLTSVAEESMWVLSTPVATALATLVSPFAALAFGIAMVLIGVRLLADRTYEPPVGGSAARSVEDGPAPEDSRGRGGGSPSAGKARLWTGGFVVLLLVLILYGAFQSTTGIAIVAFA